MERLRKCVVSSTAPATTSLLLGVFAWTVTVHAAPPPTDPHVEWHKRLQKEGPKMQMAAATFFGTAGTEEFTGVTVLPDGTILACGNSWGAPFPEPVRAECIGDDKPWDVPLYVPGMEKDRQGRALRPSDKNPNRTGFLVFFSPDLRKVTRIVRFGWGTASVDSLLLLRDGGVIVAGTSTQKLREAAKKARPCKTVPKKADDPTYGDLLYEGVTMPGDVYVARLTTKLDGLDWVWILEGHRKPPARLHEGTQGSVVFQCHSLKRIAGNGSALDELPYSAATATGEQKEFLGVSAADGTLLVGGSRSSATGRETWVGPLLDIVKPDGTLRSRVYDWQGPLAGNDRFRAVANSGLSHASFLPDGRVAVCAVAPGTNSVLARNPVNLLKPAARAAAAPAVREGAVWTGRGGTPPSVAHLALFDPQNYGVCSHVCWPAFLPGGYLGQISVDGVAGLEDGRIGLWGQNSAGLLQTTTAWYRAPDHYQYERPPEPGSKSGGTILYAGVDGWPLYHGLAGRGPWVTVFDRDFGGVVWSSAMVNCVPVAMAGGKNGIVVVSQGVGGGENDGAGRDPNFVKRDITNWQKFVALLRKQGASADPSPGRQVWQGLSAELRQQLGALSPSDDLAATSNNAVKEAVYREMSGLLKMSSLYAPEAWKGAAFDRHETEAIEALKAGKLDAAGLADLNRRLIEYGFPDCVFRCPKSNWPPIVEALQEKHGGGYSDGHICLLTLPAGGPKP